MVQAFILIKSDVGREKIVLENLKNIPEVNYVHIVYGAYDLVCKIEQETLTKLKDKITREIRSLSGVRNTVSMILVQ